MLTAIKSDIGKVREINEDCAIIHQNVEGFHIAIVADGVGGHQAGEIASALALEVITRELLSPFVETTDWKSRIEQAILTANKEIYEYGNNHQLEGMGTTVVTVVVNEQEIFVGHVGDSRLYLVSHNTIEQMTVDHSLVQQLLKNGQITEDEAFRHPQKNVILRALGTDPDTVVDLSTFMWTENNVLLLCTDGLTDRIPHDEISSIIFSQESLVEAVNQLITAALDAGGEDNITVVLLKNDLTAK
ncbi:MAG: Stp1/IreP family PP2C-type Ser/Thr phosphatase [Bacilli bacterium]